jgi:DNA-binding transcriptional LysR family regulator
LLQHHALVYSTVQGDAHWHFTGLQASVVTVPVNGPLRSNNLSALLMAARNGMGIAALPRYVAQESVNSGALTEVLVGWSLPSQEIHAVYPSPLLVPAKVSGFVAWLQSQIGDAWWESRW